MTALILGIVAGFVFFVVVLLFDTLAECFGLGRYAEKAVREVHGLEDARFGARRGSRSAPAPDRDPRDRTVA